MSINDTKKPEEKKTKVIPINKYSIYEMKSAIDKNITDYLENNKFTENHYLSNMKILVGLFCLIFTGLAYLYPKPFPENYNVVLLSVIMYIIGSIAYYYVEKYMIKQIFYSGSKEGFTRYSSQIKLIHISSEIKDHSKFYEIWFDFTTIKGENIHSDRLSLDCSELCDDRGYVVKSIVQQKFKNLIEDQIEKKFK